MQAGKLNRLVTIEQKTATVNELGEHTSGWQTVATVWASIIKKSGLETIRSNMEMSIVQASIRVRYRTDIKANMRVVYLNEVFDIRAVMPDTAKRKYADLLCEIGVSNG